MKKKLIVFSSILVVLSVFMSMMLSVSAKTIFTLNGYDYAVTSNTSVSVCGWDNRSEELLIPDAIMGRKVTAIDDSAFADNSYISSLDFSQTSRLSTIGLFAFANCTNISNIVTIPETVTKIKDNAFEGCSSIPSVNIEAELTYIAQFTFHQCTALTEVKLPDSLLRMATPFQISRIGARKSATITTRALIRTVDFASPQKSETRAGMNSSRDSRRRRLLLT